MGRDNGDQDFSAAEALLAKATPQDQERGAQRLLTHIFHKPEDVDRLDKGEA